MGREPKTINFGSIDSRGDNSTFFVKTLYIYGSRKLTHNFLQPKIHVYAIKQHLIEPLSNPYSLVINDEM